MIQKGIMLIKRSTIFTLKIKQLRYLRKIIKVVTFNFQEEENNQILPYLKGTSKLINDLLLNPEISLNNVVGY